MQRFLVVKGTVMYGGKLYRKATVFEASPLHVEKLVAEGFIVPVEHGGVDQSSEPIEIEMADPIETDTIELPTPEEFAAMKADQQKKLLTDAGIEPATNAEGRMEQFMKLYESADEV